MSLLLCCSTAAFRFIFVLLVLGFLLAHPHPIEERARADGIGVRATRNPPLTDNVALDGGEGRLRRQIGAELEKIGDVAHTLPAYHQPQRTVCG